MTTQFSMQDKDWYEKLIKILDDGYEELAAQLAKLEEYDAKVRGVAPNDHAHGWSSSYDSAIA